MPLTEAVLLDFTPAFTFIHSLSLSLSEHQPPLVFTVVSLAIDRSNYQKPDLSWI